MDNETSYLSKFTERLKKGAERLLRYLKKPKIVVKPYEGANFYGYKVIIPQEIYEPLLKLYCSEGLSEAYYDPQSIIVDEKNKTIIFTQIYIQRNGEYIPLYPCDVDYSYTLEEILDWYGPRSATQPQHPTAQSTVGTTSPATQQPQQSLEQRVAQTAQPTTSEKKEIRFNVKQLEDSTYLVETSQGTYKAKNVNATDIKGKDGKVWDGLIVLETDEGYKVINKFGKELGSYSIKPEVVEREGNYYLKVGNRYLRYDINRQKLIGTDSRQPTRQPTRSHQTSEQRSTPQTQQRRRTQRLEEIVSMRLGEERKEGSLNIKATSAGFQINDIIYPSTWFRVYTSQTGEKLLYIPKEDGISIWNPSTGKVLETCEKVYEPILLTGKLFKGIYVLAKKDGKEKIYKFKDGVLVESVLNSFPEKVWRKILKGIALRKKTIQIAPQQEPQRTRSLPSRLAELMEIEDPEEETITYPYE